MQTAILVTNECDVLINDPDYDNKNKKLILSIDNMNKIDYFYINQTFIIMISLIYLKQFRNCVPQDEDVDDGQRPPGK